MGSRNFSTNRPTILPVTDSGGIQGRSEAMKQLLDMFAAAYFFAHKS